MMKEVGSRWKTINLLIKENAILSQCAPVIDVKLKSQSSTFRKEDWYNSVLFVGNATSRYCDANLLSSPHDYTNFSVK